MLNILFIIIVLFFFHKHLYAEDLVASASAAGIPSLYKQKKDEDLQIDQLIIKEHVGHVIDEVIILGNISTDKSVIERNVSLKKGEKFTEKDFLETIQDLKNTQVFSVIKIDVTTVKDKVNNQDLARVFVKVVEKWTLLPYFLAGSGGGTSYFLVGLYDTNFLGRLYTLNFTYGCKGVNCSTFFFFRNPAFLDYGINMVNYVTLQSSIFRIYDKNRNIVGAFSNQQNLYSTTFDFNVYKTLGLGVGIIYMTNTVGDSGLKTSDVAANNRNHFNEPRSSTNPLYELRVKFGNINYDGFMADGSEFTFLFDSSPRGPDPRAEKDFYSTNNTVIFFKLIPYMEQTTFAFRGNISLTTSDLITHRFYLGGLDKIRGFYDGEFSGKFSWYTNTEVRSVQYENNYIALQPTIFSDAGSASNHFSNIYTRHLALSVGAGIRLAFPKINRVALRVDLAKTLTPFSTYGVSLGLLQFF